MIILKLINALEYDSDAILYKIDNDDKNKNKAAPQSSPISPNMMKSDLDLLKRLQIYRLAYDHLCIFSSTFCFQDLSSKHSNKAHALVHTSLLRT